MDYQKLFQDMEKRTSLYLFDDSFLSIVAFVYGCDTGNDRGLLAGFKEWLFIQRGRVCKHGWEGVVLHLAFPEGYTYPKRGMFSPEQEAQAKDTLFRFLHEFLELRRKRGTVAILEDYVKWKLAKDQLMDEFLAEHGDSDDGHDDFRIKYEKWEKERTAPSERPDAE